jgi:predicted ATPase
MSRIRIKNFGPIKEGYLENDGFIDIKKVTILIGNQGSGKSTLAKTISTMMWIEKALVRGDFEMPQSLRAVSRHFNYQGLKNYFQPNTLIEYQGKAFNIAFKHSNIPEFLTTKNGGGNYKLPKIMYVPAERNFLSVLKNAFDVKGLPETLFTFAEELKRAQLELYNEPLDLPINDYKYLYDNGTNTSFVIGNGYKLKLNEASSGLQSTIPLYLVSKNLAELINSPESRHENSSVNQRIKRDNEIVEVMRDSILSIEEKIKKIDLIEARYQNRIFVNIVEEPEQNLFPSSQRKMLNSLLSFNNLNAGNELIITTHSPYLINYLTLSVKADFLLKKGLSDVEKNKLQKVVPLTSTVCGEDLSIYELNEKSGTIKKVESYNGLPSDENELNEKLGETNELFAKLLEIQQTL